MGVFYDREDMERERRMAGLTVIARGVYHTCHQALVVETRNELRGCLSAGKAPLTVADLQRELGLGRVAQAIAAVDELVGRRLFEWVVIRGKKYLRITGFKEEQTRCERQLYRELSKMRNFSSFNMSVEDSQVVMTENCRQAPPELSTASCGKLVDNLGKSVDNSSKPVENSKLEKPDKFTTLKQGYHDTQGVTTQNCRQCQQLPVLGTEYANNGDLNVNVKSTTTSEAGCVVAPSLQAAGGNANGNGNGTARPPAGPARAERGPNVPEQTGDVTTERERERERFAWRDGATTQPDGQGSRPIAWQHAMVERLQSIAQDWHSTRFYERTVARFALTAAGAAALEAIAESLQALVNTGQSPTRRGAWLTAKLKQTAQAMGIELGLRTGGTRG